MVILINSATISNLGLDEKPHLIFNLDETSSCRDSFKTKIAGQKEKPSSITTSTTGKGNISIWLTISAEEAKSLLWSSSKEGSKKDVYPGLTYVAAKDGWIEINVSKGLFFCKIFIPSLKGERPALIVCDGHQTHVSLNLVEIKLQYSMRCVMTNPKVLK
ncbi:hypothetical protein JTB14_033419 [Gonioctena quinquepunctata]|nr:hypothetical protein JTB14_033419 [Gonioctena quinquepunctata]